MAKNTSMSFSMFEKRNTLFRNISFVMLLNAISHNRKGGFFQYTV